MKKAKKSSVVKRVAIGTGVAAGVAAAAAGMYLLYGSKHAAKNRRLVKAWSLKARAEVLERLENLSEINEKVYRQVVEEVSARYKKLKHLSSKEVGEFGAELKKHWKDIAKDMRAPARAPRAANRKKKR
jgi:hypothetical protein